MGWRLRVGDDGAIFFGCNDMHQELTPASRAAFEPMMQDLGRYRHPLASDTRHPLYRAQAERWLESLVRNDVTRVDSVLDSRFVYAQVFAGCGAEHGIIDVLTITRAGRLAILELEATEHIHLPLPAADYWLKVRRHLELGEFRSYGYFPGVEIQEAPPLVYLVAPALRFHPVTGILLARAVAAGRSGSRELDGKLASGDSRGYAPKATRTRSRPSATVSRIIKDEVRRENISADNRNVCGELCGYRRARANSVFRHQAD